MKIAENIQELFLVREGLDRFFLPVLSLSIILSVILFIGVVLLEISGFSERWLKRCCRVLYFAIIPVFSLIANLTLRIPPMFLTVVLWLITGGLILKQRVYKIRYIKEMVRKNEAWFCSDCHHLNEIILIECEKCGGRNRNGRNK